MWGCLFYFVDREAMIVSVNQEEGFVAAGEVLPLPDREKSVNYNNQEDWYVDTSN